MAPGRYAAALGLLFFLAVLAATDWSLSRWGSATMRRRPRPGRRVTVLFFGVCLVCGLLELLAGKLWPLAPAASVAVLVVQLPAGVAVVLGLDRIVPNW